MEFCFDGIVDKWCECLPDTDEVLIFSPYLTSNTADSVAEHIDAKRCEIYTQFSDELFINQSSSIDTLIKLKEMGATLYSLPELHAKLFIAPGVFASLGSQNLTNKGISNLEANVVFHDEVAIQEIHEQAKKWILHREEISLTMLKKMKVRVGPYIKKFQKILEKVELIKQEAEAEQKSIQKRKAWRAELKKTLFSLEKSKKEIGIVKHLPGTNSFVVRHKGDFTNWEFEYGIEKLDSKKRYVCWLADTGKFGWARLGKGRITFIESAVERTDIVSLGGHLCNIGYHANWDVRALDQGKENVGIVIEPLDVV